MSFLPLLPSSGPRVLGKRLRIVVERTGRNLDKRRLTFGLSRELAEVLAWQPGDRIVIAMGLGPDLGRAQLSRVDRPNAGHKLISYAQSRVLRVCVTTPLSLQGQDMQPVLDAFLDPAAVDFAIADGTLVAQLTPLRAVESAPGNVVAFA